MSSAGTQTFRQVHAVCQLVQSRAHYSEDALPHSVNEALTRHRLMPSLGRLLLESAVSWLLPPNRQPLTAA